MSAKVKQNLGGICLFMNSPAWIVLYLKLIVEKGVGDVLESILKVIIIHREQ